MTLNSIYLPRKLQFLTVFVFLLCAQGCQDPAPNSQQKPAFDAARAYASVQKQVDFGPRIAGSDELAQTRAYMIAELHSYGLAVREDAFEANTPIGSRHMSNVIGELPGTSNEVIMIASHYDTKLFKEFRFVGANDGASSTAAVLEIARVMATSETKPRFTYWFVFFDGEESLCKAWDECKTPDGGDDNTYGSRHLALSLKASGDMKRVRALILLDMVGYKDLQLGRDNMGTAWLVDLVWGTAYGLGLKQFKTRSEGVGGDDHDPFLKAGVPAMDIIQLSTYPHWHTAEDTIDKISPESLKAVGDTVLASLPALETQLAAAVRN